MTDSYPSIVDESSRPEPLSTRGRLVSLTIEGFRGFNRRTHLDFDASAVLLQGQNGSGKSSVFDALQWLLTGDLPRLHPWRLRKNDEFVVNAFSSPHIASVEATFRVGGVELRAVRKGDGRGSFIELSEGARNLADDAAMARLAAALAPGDLPLSDVLYTSGLLQQDDLRQILQTKPDARYRQLMRLLGLDSVDSFERMCSSRRVRAREGERAALANVERARLAEARAIEQLETARLQVELATQGIDIGSSVNDLLRTEGNALRSRVTVSSADQLPRMAAEAARLGRLAQSLLQAIDRLPDEIPRVAEDEVAQASAALAAAQEQERQAEEALIQAREVLVTASAANDAVNQLAAAALPLLSADGDAPCPVCGSVVDHPAVAAALSARARGADALVSARSLVEQAQVSVNRRREHSRQASDTLAALHANARVRDSALEVAQDITTQLAAMSAGSFLVLESSQELIAFEESSREKGLPAGLTTDLREALRSLLLRLSTQAQAVEAGVQTLIQQEAGARVGAERSAALPRQVEAVVKARAAREEAEADLTAAGRADRQAAAVAESARAAAAEIFRERFALLEPLMNDVYARLDPHPAFTQLTFVVESYRSKGTATAVVRDAERGIAMNPMLIFSSAQANIVVLSAFLALGWAAGSNSLPFLLLDDPLQALDDVNVLGFADLARRVRRERQLVVATHEQRFAGLLERKLAGRLSGEDLIVHRFVGWSRSGPEIDTRRVSPQPTLSRVLAA